MRGRFVPTLVAYALGMTCSPAVVGQIKVEPDKENVVASRLEGDWQLDTAVTKHLTERDVKAGRTISSRATCGRGEDTQTEDRQEGLRGGHDDRQRYENPGARVHSH